MHQEWLYIGVFMVVSLALPGVAIWLAGVLAPKKPNEVKTSTYECGIETVGETWIQFKAQYYVYALIFLVFDVEAVFMFPWAVAFDQLPLYAVLEGVTFVLILAAGLAYAWKKGALEWS
jgi:NADH:ubiquinone oxidoreductase subunit 3 (subunit A)